MSEPTPTSGRPTSAPPRTVSGHVWRCFSTGVMQTEWRTEDGRCTVTRTPRLSGFNARTDGQLVVGANPAKAKLFQTLANAMIGAVAARKDS